MEDIKEKTAKDFAIEKANEIASITMDLKYTRNMFLIHKGLEEIERLANGILEHLEYLDIKIIEG
jgi:hypothetical protein